MDKRNVLIHIHIFKNAGTSFDGALHDFFGNDFIDHREDKKLLNGKMEYLLNFLENNSNIKAFSSHSIYFLLKNTSKFNFLPVYFLRHPIERIRSVYNFEKKQIPVNTLGAKKAKELNFNEYVKWYMQEDSPATIRNIHTIFLSGDGPAPVNMEKKFKIALENVKSLPLIGLVHRYDESMVVFEEYLKQYFPGIDLSYVRKNVTDTNFELPLEEKIKKVLSQLDVKTQKEVIEKNNFDLKLFEEANKQFDIKINKIDNFKQKLENFKERCILKKVRQKRNQKDFNSIINILNSLKKPLSNVKLFLELINAYIEQKQFLEALKLCEKAIEKFPNNSYVYFYQIQIYNLMGDIEKAKKLFNIYKNKFKENKNLNKVLDEIF